VIIISILFNINDHYQQFMTKIIKQTMLDLIIKNSNIINKII